MIRLIHVINHVKVLEGKGHFYEGSQGNKGFTVFKDAFHVCCLYNADVCVFVTTFFLNAVTLEAMMHILFHGINIMNLNKIITEAT